MQDRTLDRSRAHTIYLPDSQWDELSKRAYSSNVSVSDLVRGALDVALAPPPKVSPVPQYTSPSSEPEVDYFSGPEKPAVEFRPAPKSGRPR